MDIIKVFLQFIEALAMVLAASGIIGKPFATNRISITVVLFGLSISGIRAVYKFMGIPLGSHTLVLLVIFACLLIFVCNATIGKAFVGSFVVMVLLLTGEVLMAYTFETLGLDMETVQTQPQLYSIFIPLSHSLLWLTFLATNYFHVSIFGKVASR